MCEINEMLNNFMRERNIKDDALMYQYTVRQGGTTLICSDGEGIEYHSWQQKQNREHNQGEVVQININDTYSDWHERLPNDPQGVITEILNWGFGHKTDQGRSNMINKHLTSIKNLLRRNVDSDDILFGAENEDISKSWKNISSWSKVLAAYNLKRYFIYDSRVAIALNFISGENNWYLPEMRGHNMVFAIIKQNQTRGQVRTLKESYRCYCESLRQQGGVALERQLFMLGKMLDFRCKNWRKCIFVNSDLANQ